MNDDLISRRAALLEFIEKGQHSSRYKCGELWKLNGEEIREVLFNLPTVQLKTGRWIIEDDCELFIAKCSECEATVDSRDLHYRKSNYRFCGNCGAKMGEKE